MALQGPAELLRKALGRAKLEKYLDAAAEWLESEWVCSQRFASRVRQKTYQ